MIVPSYSPPLEPGTGLVISMSSGFHLKGMFLALRRSASDFTVICILARAIPYGLTSFLISEEKFDQIRPFSIDLQGS